MVSGTRVNCRQRDVRRTRRPFAYALKKKDLLEYSPYKDDPPLYLYVFSRHYGIPRGASMSPRLPKYPNCSIRPRIDHDRLANEDVEKLRRRIRYPSSSKTYKGTERLEAVRECLHNRVRDEQSMVAFAYRVAGDPRTSRPMWDFANEAIRKSKTYIQKKMKKLEALRKHWRKQKKGIARLYEGIFTEYSNWRLGRFQQVQIQNHALELIVLNGDKFVTAILQATIVL